MKHSRVSAEGHLIDSGLLSRCFGVVIEGGGTYEVLRMEVGRTKRDFSRADLEVRAPTAERLGHIVDNLAALGFRLIDDEDAATTPAPRNGVAPDHFYASTHHRTEVRIAGRWHEVRDQRMDGVIVVGGLRAGGGSRGARGERRAAARCVLIRDLRRGDRVVCGVSGVRTYPPFAERRAESFAFMRSEASSERAVVVKAREVAGLVRAAKREGRKVVAVPGPVVVHTGGGDAFCRLVERGWIDAVLSGNALAVHDVERALYGTSLGIDVDRGIPAAEGHMHHLRAINVIRREGSLANAVQRRVLKKGIMRALVANRIPFVLAGSIRDDGPLPDTEMDLIAAQRRYAEVLRGAGLVIVLASMLHGIGVGNMTPSDVPLVCVDIHSSVVTKLADRGSAQTIGIVTDVSAFVHRLDAELAGRPAKSRKNRTTKARSIR